MPTSTPTIEKWFAKPIYVVNGFHENRLSEYKKELESVFASDTDFKRTLQLNVQSTHNSPKLHTNIVFEDFVKDLREHVFSFMTILGYRIDIEDVWINSMWSNKTVQGEYLFPHVHPHSIISGAFYVHIDSPEDVIMFFDNVGAMVMPTNEANQLSYENCSYACTPGRLLLFRSDLQHGCPALKGKDKIVISFNAELRRKNAD